jgi:hypothetical protein
MLLRIALLLAVTAAAAVTAQAQIQPHQWSTSGLGAHSCGKFSVAILQDPKFTGWEIAGKTYQSEAGAFVQWAAGFVTAANLHGKPGPGQIVVDVDGMGMWLKTYCESHPSQSFYVAVSEFVTKHHPK